MLLNQLVISCGWGVEGVVFNGNLAVLAEGLKVDVGECGGQ